MTKMRAIFGLHLILLVLQLLISQGTGQCDLNNIGYGVERSGRVVEGQDEWNVKMYHTCTACSMGNIIFKNCENWHTVEPVDEDILLKHDRFCLLNRGHFLRPGETVYFSYAWNEPVVWIPSSADVRC